MKHLRTVQLSELQRIAAWWLVAQRLMQRGQIPTYSRTALWDPKTCRMLLAVQDLRQHLLKEDGVALLKSDPQTTHFSLRSDFFWDISRYPKHTQLPQNHFMSARFGGSATSALKLQTGWVSESSRTCWMSDARRPIKFCWEVCETLWNCWEYRFQSVSIGFNGWTKRIRKTRDFVEPILVSLIFFEQDKICYNVVRMETDPELPHTPAWPPWSYDCLNRFQVLSRWSFLKWNQAPHWQLQAFAKSSDAAKNGNLELFDRLERYGLLKNCIAMYRLYI